MKTTSPKWMIIGGGLAGTCLAWEFWRRKVDFRWVDRGRGGSSRMAAGMINPITGKNFEPSWRIADFLPQALEMYASVEGCIGKKLWHALPVLRLAESEKEWEKIVGKLKMPDVTPWVFKEVEAPDGWAGAVELGGGGRLDTAAFLDGSREFFSRNFGITEWTDRGDEVIWCEGAAGLMTERYGPQRCAKGEILTVRAEGWDETQIRVGAGGWLIPQGGGIFKAGSTYEWNLLDEEPSEKGRLRVEEILAKLGGATFEVIDHHAAIRPILRRSQPLIGRMPDGGWMMNALGSKGSLYAPGMAARLADRVMDGKPVERCMDFAAFLEQARDDGN